MEIKAVLQELGLSDGEIKVYLALLKLGECPVNKLKAETKMHRTTIYDFLEKLLNKALVSYVVKDGANWYRAAHPNKLLEFLKDKENNLQQVLPELVKLAEFEKQDLTVEVYRGKEGFKTLMNLVLKNREKTHYGFGFDEIRYEKLIGSHTMKQFFNNAKKAGLQEYGFISEEAAFRYEYPFVHYKTIPKEYFNPNTITAFGDYVAFHIWEPLSFILIKNNNLAEGYKKHFRLLWDNPVRAVTGEAGVRKAYVDMVDELSAGDEYICFGASSISDPLLDTFVKLMEKLHAKGTKQRLIFDEGAKAQIENVLKHGGKVKTLPKEFITPAEVNIYKDKTFIVLFSKNPIAMVIENKEITHSFRKYFEVMWGMAKSVS